MSYEMVMPSNAESPKRITEVIDNVKIAKIQPPNGIQKSVEKSVV